MSARSYSTTDNNNYDNRKKSMVCGSGAAAKAYILSNYGASSQHLIAFDPLSFSTSPIWAKKPITALTSSSEHSGLTFGRGESFLYAFSWFNL